MGGLCRAEDDLTHKLAEIIKANKALKAQEEAGSPQHIIREFANLLQFHITTYFDNTKPGIPVAQQRSGRCACHSAHTSKTWSFNETSCTQPRSVVLIVLFGVRVGGIAALPLHTLQGLP